MKKTILLAAGVIIACNMAFGAVAVYDKDGMKVEIGADVRVQEVMEMYSDKVTTVGGVAYSEKATSKLGESLERAKLYVNFSKGPVSGALVTDKGAIHRDTFVKLALADALYLQYNYRNNQMFVGDQLETKWEAGKDSAIINLYGENREGVKAGLKLGTTELFGGVLYDAPGALEIKDAAGTVTGSTNETYLGLKGGATVALDKVLKITGEASMITEGHKLSAKTDYSVTGFGANVRGELAMGDMKLKPEALMLIESKGAKKISGSGDDNSNKKDASTFAAAVKAEMPAMDIAVAANMQTITTKDASDKDAEKTTSMYVTPSVEFKKIIGDAGIYMEAKYAPKTVEKFVNGTSVTKTDSTTITPKVMVKFKF